MSIFCVKHDAEWLHNSAAHVVLVQPNVESTQLLLGDKARARVLQTLDDLLVKKRLENLVTQSIPALVLLPEMALAFSDWDKVDALVRGYKHPVILIAGFSVTRGDVLKKWAQRDGDTKCAPGWCPDKQIGDERSYNGGFCWVHDGNKSTQCYAFLKISAEQQAEVRVEGLDVSRTAFAIELTDLLLFPMICSDLLAQDGGHKRATKAISAYLGEHHKGNKKPIFIAGLLCQNEPHSVWRTSISDAVREIDTSNVNLCLVNWGYPHLCVPQDEDRWRNYTGVYIAQGRKPLTKAFSQIHQFGNELIAGSVARHPGPSVVAGAVRWQYSVGSDGYVWQTSTDYAIAPDGSISGSPTARPIQFEMLRIIDRLERALGSAEHELQRKSLAIVRQHLLDDNNPKSELFADQCLNGEKSPELVCPDALPKHILELDPALKVIGALAQLPSIKWQDNNDRKGQLTTDDPSVGIVIWASPKSQIFVRQKIDDWRAASLSQHDRYLIFHKYFGADAVAHSPMSERRSDITSAPTGDRERVVDVEKRKTVGKRNLDDLSEHLYGDVKTGLTQMDGIVSSELATLGGHFERGL